MIPEQATEENIKPVLAMMMPSVVYNIDAVKGAGRTNGFVWMDAVYVELKKSNVVTATFDSFFVAMSYRLVDDP